MVERPPRRRVRHASRAGMEVTLGSFVARMEPTGRAEGAPDDELRAMRGPLGMPRISLALHPRCRVPLRTLSASARFLPNRPAGGEPMTYQDEQRRHFIKPADGAPPPR